MEQKSTPLNTKDALRLYSLLRPHLGALNLDEAILLDVADQIIRDMVSTGNGRKYVDAVVLMTKRTVEDLQSLEPAILLGLFIDGLIINSLPNLVVFGDRMGLNGSPS